MSDLAVKASSDDVGLRREATIDAAELPIWLARLHRSVPANSQVRITIAGDLPLPIEVFMEGAGFRSVGNEFVSEVSLPDMVRPGLKAIVCGLNPSPTSAETRVAFGRNGNRFWPAAIAAGLLSKDRDPDHSLGTDRVGFTDLAKRCTSKASQISDAEFAAGLSRLERLVGWAQPKSLIIVGLGGWRIATGTQAGSGWLDRSFGDTPIYLMPNTSGLNAHETVESLAEHFRIAQQVPDSD